MKKNYLRWVSETLSEREMKMVVGGGGACLADVDCVLGVSCISGVCGGEDNDGGNGCNGSGILAPGQTPQCGGTCPPKILYWTSDNIPVTVPQSCSATLNPLPGGMSGFICECK